MLGKVFSFVQKTMPKDDVPAQEVPQLSSPAIHHAVHADGGKTHASASSDHCRSQDFFTAWFHFSSMPSMSGDNFDGQQAVKLCGWQQSMGEQKCDSHP